MNEYMDRGKYPDEALIWIIEANNPARNMQEVRAALLARMRPEAPQDDEWEDVTLGKYEILQKGDMFRWSLEGGGVDEEVYDCNIGRRVGDFRCPNITRRVRKEKPQPAKPDMGAFSVQGNALHYNGNKPKTVQEAKSLSQQKWNIMKWYAEVEGVLLDDGCQKTCGLCMYYRDNFDCGKCPIARKTGRNYCRNTPFHDYASARANGVIPRGVKAINDEIALLASIEVEDEAPQVKFAIAGTKDAELPGVVVLELVQSGNYSNDLCLHCKNRDLGWLLSIDKYTGKVKREEDIRESIGFPLDDQGRLVIE
jgi:hypothetical protein